MQALHEKMAIKQLQETLNKLKQITLEHGERLIDLNNENAKLRKVVDAAKCLDLKIYDPESYIPEIHTLHNEIANLNVPTPLPVTPKQEESQKPSLILVDAEGVEKDQDNPFDVGT